MDHIFYNAHHSPIGAFATLTLGFKGPKGGFGLEMGKPADENIFIGLQNKENDSFTALPFFEFKDDESRRYEVEATGGNLEDRVINVFDDTAIKRDFQLASDSWNADDLTFTIYSPVTGVPDPETASDDDLKKCLVPALMIDVTVDNSTCRKDRVAFFGYEGNDPYSRMRHLSDVANGKYVGVGQGTRTAIVSADDGVYTGCGFTIDSILKPEVKENLSFGLGPVVALVMPVKAGEKRTFKVAVCFFHGGIVTAGLETSYFYYRYFKSIEQVAEYALNNFDTIRQQAIKENELVKRANLSDSRKFQLIHAVHSYYGSTEFLDADGEPFWVVNEGEYRMMNTFDLTVDQLFFELERNPWTVRNELDWFVKRYSYTDKVLAPGSDTQYPGGLSFTHDMGVANTFSRPHYSSYELYGLDGCFSHMTHEELVNWLLCALLYIHKTNDQKWCNANMETIKACLDSMLNRDHHDPEKRNGIMAFDSSRCMGGSEITTYDSLDVSLGQSRNNLYMAVKCWAVYVGLNNLLADSDKAAAEAALKQAEKCAATIVSFQESEGFIPAVMGESCDSRIISAVEGVVFPYLLGLEDVVSEDGPYGDLIKALKRHTATILKPGVCLFDDGAWKLSSSSNNSWLSKIYLCQFAIDKVLNMDIDTAEADQAHVRWLLHETQCYYAWSDQIVSGVPTGSKYYPRGVTSWLWLQ